MPSNSSKRQKVVHRDSDLLCNWLRYETLLLNRLLLRNRNVHRGAIFMRWVTSSLRFLKKFNSHFNRTKKTSELKDLARSEDFNRSYYMTLDSVVNTCVHLTRVHLHKYFVPFSSTLIGIFSRLLLILTRIPEAFGLGT